MAPSGPFHPYCAGNQTGVTITANRSPEIVYGAPIGIGVDERLLEKMAILENENKTLRSEVFRLRNEANRNRRK